MGIYTIRKTATLIAGLIPEHLLKIYPMIGYVPPVVREKTCIRNMYDVYCRDRLKPVSASLNCYGNCLLIKKEKICQNGTVGFAVMSMTL